MIRFRRFRFRFRLRFGQNNLKLDNPSRTATGQPGYDR
jgi:hypothetical protein